MESRDLRVSDAEREYVGQLLQRAVGQGMLSLGEFTERMDTALAARTRGDLNSVVCDLPGIRVVGDEAGVAQQVPAAPAPTDIRARLSGVTRKGPWQVPPTLTVESWLAEVTLDFTSAVLQSRVVEVNVTAFCGSITLVVPPDATVDLDGVECIAGSSTNKVRSGPPSGPLPSGPRSSGPLHLVVRGTATLGSVTAKHPFGTGIKRLLG